MLTKEHRRTDETLYKVWYGMKSRCNNPNNEQFHNYGGRGIKIKEWSTYENFKQWALQNGYEDGLTIDRINVNDDYYPKNCRWITIQEQQLNKRNNKYYTFKNKKLLLKDWSKLVNIKQSTLYSRLNTLHWSFEKTIQTPLKQNIKQKNKLD